MPFGKVLLFRQPESLPGTPYYCSSHPFEHAVALQPLHRALARTLLHHITTADQVEREHEHDMRALKRQTVEALRRGAKKGHKTLYVWDKAAIDFEAREQWKRSAIYFLSQEKSNMVVVRVSKTLPWETSDPRNAGRALLRRIEFVDPITGNLYVFLTNEMTLPPGLLAKLARRRWNIEKVFDDKLGETRAWATSATAKSMQAVFICLAHQLLLAFEDHLDQQEDIRPEANSAAAPPRMASRSHPCVPPPCGSPSALQSFCAGSSRFPAPRRSLARSHRIPKVFLRDNLAGFFQHRWTQSYIRMELRVARGLCSPKHLHTPPFPSN